METFFGNTRNKLTSMVLAIVVWAYAFGNTGHEEIREAIILLKPANDIVGETVRFLNVLEAINHQTKNMNPDRQVQA